MLQSCLRLCAFVAIALSTSLAPAQLKTWDGKHSIERIEVSLVYFLPKDRKPLPDWRERLNFYQRRIEQFHQRELLGQSTLTAIVRPEPFVSDRSTEQLRAGDANFIFYQTLREVDGRLNFGRDKERQAFPILLVMSDINWRPLDDFFRVKPVGEKFEFEGQLISGRHHPGATSGGARATYLADRGVGWGLVSADGWRVPYCGSDCVAYHEGVGHTIGLPHNEPGDGAVMSLGQYRGWISRSWLDEGQKKRLGFKAPETKFDRAADLFSTFTALPQPSIPKPGEDVQLQLTLPMQATLKSCRVRLQTELFGAWLDVSNSSPVPANGMVTLGKFDRPTPVSYRVDVETTDGQTAELWGYFQVRSKPNEPPQPVQFEGSVPVSAAAVVDPEGQPEIDVLKLIDTQRDQVTGEWKLEDGKLVSPKQFGARLELPGDAPAEYRLIVIAEPLDKPNGLILGQRVSGNRCLVLLNYATDKARGAIENVDGKNVGSSSTTFERAVFEPGRLSQVVCTVRQDSIRVSVDGREVISWQGDPKRLSLGDYWKTPHPERLFIGAYDCRYRIHRLTIEPLK